MKKVLCAIIGLLFAVPSFANCNLFDGQWQQGTFQNTGEEANSSTRIRSGFIPVNSGHYTISTPTQNVVIHEVYCYDSSENFVSKLDVSDIVVPATAKYLRFSAKYNDNSNISPSSGVLVQLERGSTATEYTPYNPLCATCDGQIVAYTSATGTVVQNGTPTPTNPITPVFYTQGNMVLRKVGDYADSYDATTGKITRRVGVKVFDGTEEWTNPNEHQFNFNAGVKFAITSNADEIAVIDSHFRNTASSGADGDWYASVSALPFATCLHNSGTGMRFKDTSINTLAEWKQWLAQQYAAGTPVTAWYPLATVVEETVPASYCQQAIKVASTKYVETQFSVLGSRLAAAVATVNTVVSNTIIQAASIATLQSGKQTRPADDTCPAGKKCLLVEGTDGKPHWYEIVESILQTDYTVLEYISSSGTQYIDTGVTLTNDVSYVANIGTTKNNILGLTGIVWQSGLMFQIRYYSNGEFNITDGFGTYAENVLYNVGFNVDKARFCKDDLCVTKTQDIVNNSTRIKTGVYDMIASLKIYDNDTLVRNMIPVKRNSDGALGMYDTVNNRFYTNAGTGTFIAGPVAE
ncbi:MAG: hypothetical protein ACLRFM_01505 [Alphaproteobacteria bacterium]